MNRRFFSKLLLISCFLMTSSPAFASGYRCHAICISLIPDQQSLTFLGFAKQAADLPREDVFNATQEKCEQKAVNQGYDLSSAMLVNQISFSSKAQDRWVDESNGSSYSVGRGSAFLSGNWYAYTVSRQGYTEAYSTFHHDHEHDHDQSLVAQPQFSYPRDCRFDKTIRSGTQLTYTGDQKFYP